MVPTDLSDDGGHSAAGSMAFGHFRVPRQEDGSLWKLGEGNMGVTYRAFDTSLRTEVALKVITANRVNDEETRRRFQREARAAAKIRHPNVANVLYLGEEGGECFYAMEFVAGYSLDTLLKASGGPLPPVIAVALAAQVAAGLNAAHRRQVVHRDLKPANLMLLDGEAMDQEDHRTQAAGDRQIKVIDFGLARSFSADRQDESMVTQTVSGFIGTPMYSSPEQAAGESDIDGRSDLYSLGIILWQMLAGTPPFTGKVVEVMRKHLITTPPFENLPPGLPDSLVALLRGLLNKEAATRDPQAAGEVRNRLDACLVELGGVSPYALASATDTASGTAAGTASGTASGSSSGDSTRVSPSPLLATAADTAHKVPTLPVLAASPAAVPFRPRKRWGPVIFGVSALVLLGAGAFAFYTYQGKQNPPAVVPAAGTMPVATTLYPTPEPKVQASQPVAAASPATDNASATGPRNPLLMARDSSNRQIPQPVESQAMVSLAPPAQPSPKPTIVILEDPPEASPAPTPAPAVAAAPMPATYYRGEIRDGPTARATVVPVIVKLDGDGLNGTITYGSRLGDTSVRFKANRDGNDIQGVTSTLITKPDKVKWDGEVFRLRLSADGGALTYECEIPKSDLRGTLRRDSFFRP